MEPLQSTDKRTRFKPEAEVEGADSLGLEDSLGLMVGFGVSATSGEFDSSIAFTVSSDSLFFSCLLLSLF